MRVPFCPPFLAGEPRATGLLPDRFRSPAAWREEAEARRSFRVAPDLLAALAAQDAALPPSQSRRRNLDALASPGTVAVVTGQQVGLFLGPLYTFHKAASCIVWARAVERETGARCVPIFWLQTEDHDFAEICHAAVPAPPGPPLKLSLSPSTSRCSVAHVLLGAEIDALAGALDDALADLPERAAIMAAVREAYLPGRSLAAAFAHLLAAVFAEEGLVILDPRCAEVARLALPINRAALESAGDIDAALERRGAELLGAGLLEQVHVRAGSPLVFFHVPDREGVRQRLQRDGHGYRLDTGGRIDARDVLAAAEEDPLRLSTSALLRPVVQDSLLPAVVYVGGPAEIGYLAQTAPLYPLLGVRPSLPALRGRFRLIDARTDERLRELELKPADVEEPRDALLARLGARRAGTPSPDDLTRQLLGNLPSRVDAIAADRPALARAARRTRISVERAVSRFAARHARQIAAEDRDLSDRVDRVQALLYPECTPQERVHSLPWFAARMGLSAVKSAVLAAVEPGATLVKDVRP